MHEVIKPIIPLPGEIERIIVKHLNFVIRNHYTKKPKDNA